ncbi:MAG: Holliday junction resolvase RuvX [Firmicutes bacterium]|jgi:putative Holliday junction resolvase|nr:Holliday junction resolvase RuvX [Bacillota bacterium]
MRYLGLDLGTTSLGVAISDKTNTLVSPLTLIKFKKEDYNDALNKLMEIIKDKNISKVVLGLPKNMDNSLGFAAQRSLNFKKILESENVEVILEDERLTTVEAINIMKNNGLKRINEQNKTDVLSAVLILESYLKRQNYEK